MIGTRKLATFRRPPYGLQLRRRSLSLPIWRDRVARFFFFLVQNHFPLGMNPGTPVSTTALNLTRDLIPSLISRIASSGRVETSKFSWMRLGVFEVVRGAVPRWIAQASKTCAGVLLTRLAIAMMTGSSSNLGSLLWPRAAKACSTMPFVSAIVQKVPFREIRMRFDVNDRRLDPRGFKDLLRLFQADVG